MISSEKNPFVEIIADIQQYRLEWFGEHWTGKLNLQGDKTARIQMLKLPPDNTSSSWIFMMMKNCLEAQYGVLMSSFTFLTGRSLLNGLCDDYWSPVEPENKAELQG